MAGQLLTDLKSAEKAKKTPSHEARLGILVITILVFAFGFLVYHKMDLHQRKLTEASINPAAPASSENPAAGELAEFTANTSAAGEVTADPLVKATELSNGSPFAESTDSLSEPQDDSSFPLTSGSHTASGQTETLAALQEPAAEPAFPEISPSSNETVGTNEQLPEFQFTEPAEPDAAQMADNSVAGASPADTSEQPSSVATADEAFPSPVIDLPSNDQASQLPSADPQNESLPTLIADASTSAGSDFSATESQSPGEPLASDGVPFPSEPVLADANSPPASASANSAKDDNPFGSSNSADEPVTLQPVASDETPAVAEPTLEIAAGAAAEVNPFSPSDTTASVDAQQAATDSPEATPSLPVAAAEPVLKADEPQPFSVPQDEPATKPESPEPVMIAMADPQEGSPFSGGFAPDEESPPVRKAPAAEPAFDGGAFPQSSGFDAVTNPNGKPKNQVVRNAAGSGADGKFSLAAFNYQNEAVEAAPDDGSTYESVVVQPGDNYSKISKRVYGSVRYFSALAVFNQHRISDPKKMRAGMIVLTPAASVLEERYPQLFIDSKPKVAEPAAFLLMDDGSPAYRVGERETLSQISERFLGRSSRWVEIYRLNQNVVTDPNKLKAGTILALPEDATEVSVTP